MSSPEIACTLTPQDLQKRRKELLPSIIEAADRISNLPDGIRMELAPRHGLLREIAHIIEQEQRCCRFLRFQLTIEPEVGPITVDVTGPPGTRELLQSLGTPVNDLEKNMASRAEKSSP